MDNLRSKYLEEYKKQKVYPQGINKNKLKSNKEFESDHTTYEKVTKAYLENYKKTDFQERIELIHLREENHRMAKEIEVLIEAIKILSSKVIK